MLNIGIQYIDIDFYDGFGHNKNLKFIEFFCSEYLREDAMKAGRHMSSERRMPKPPNLTGKEACWNVDLSNRQFEIFSRQAFMHKSRSLRTKLPWHTGRLLLLLVAVIIIIIIFTIITIIVISIIVTITWSTLFKEFTYTMVMEMTV